MKIPSFASSYHWGRGCRLSDSRVGSYFAGAWAGITAVNEKITTREKTQLRRAFREQRIKHLLSDSQPRSGHVPVLGHSSRRSFRAKHKFIHPESSRARQTGLCSHHGRIRSAARAPPCPHFGKRQS